MLWSHHFTHTNYNLPHHFPFLFILLGNRLYKLLKAKKKTAPNFFTLLYPQTFLFVKTVRTLETLTNGGARNINIGMALPTSLR
jgi:hypothetical protein